METCALRIEVSLKSDSDGSTKLANGNIHSTRSHDRLPVLTVAVCFV